MSVVSPLLTVMIAAARKAGKAISRDFGEVENLQLAKKSPAARFSNLPSQKSPAPIPEATDESGDTNGQQVQAKANNTRSEKSLSSNSMASSHEAKQSALIPNLSIPLNDGTHRVTFRIQMTIDTRNVEKQSDALNQSIYDFLVKVFCSDVTMRYILQKTFMNKQHSNNYE